MKTNYEKLMKINYEKLLIFYLPFTPHTKRSAVWGPNKHHVPSRVEDTTAYLPHTKRSAVWGPNNRKKTCNLKH